MLRSLYARNSSTEYEAGWSPAPVWTWWRWDKSLLWRELNSSRPARSQSLYSCEISRFQGDENSSPGILSHHNTASQHKRRLQSVYWMNYPGLLVLHGLHRPFRFQKFKLHSEYKKCCWQQSGFYPYPASTFVQVLEEVGHIPIFSILVLVLDAIQIPKFSDLKNSELVSPHFRNFLMVCNESWTKCTRLTLTWSDGEEKGICS
jgi:hypothetical protein